MFSIRAATLLPVLLVPLHSTDAALFGFLANRVLDSTCERAEEAIAGSESVSELAECDCDASWRLFRGFQASLTCETKDRVCLEGTQYCGIAEAKAELEAGLFRDGGFQAAMSIQVDRFDANTFPEALTGEIEPITITAFPDGTGFNFNECMVEIGSDTCDMCTVCDDGMSFEFSCSNVDIGGNLPVFVPGPTSERCVGFLLLSASLVV